MTFCFNNSESSFIEGYEKKSLLSNNEELSFTDNSESVSSDEYKDVNSIETN